MITLSLDINHKFKTRAFHFKLMHPWRVFVWKLETKLFASFYIWLAYIFEASYSTLMTPVRKKSSFDQS